MKYILVSYYDRKANTYTAPICEINKEVAKRNFFARMRSLPEFNISKDDMALYVIGAYDDESAFIDSNINLEYVVSFSEDVEHV